MAELNEKIPGDNAIFLYNSINRDINVKAGHKIRGKKLKNEMTSELQDELSKFKEYLKKIRAYAIDMETATIFSVGFYNKIPTGALLLVSDQPMIPEGIKTEKSDLAVTTNYVERHIRIGIEALKLVRRHGRSMKHLRFEDENSLE